MSKPSVTFEGPQTMVVGGTCADTIIDLGAEFRYPSDELSGVTISDVSEI
jgi:hypothetical protein